MSKWLDRDGKEIRTGDRVLILPPRDSTFASGFGTDSSTGREFMVGKLLPNMDAEVYEEAAADDYRLHGWEWATIYTGRMRRLS